MAEFEQSAETRAAIHDAARAFLRSPGVIARMAGTSDKKSRAYKSAQRRVQRWTARAGQEQRRPSKMALAALGGFQLHLEARIAVGGDSQYERLRQIDLSLEAAEAAALLSHAISENEEDQDDAWQDFFDVYVMPSGTVEGPQITLR